MICKDCIHEQCCRIWEPNEKYFEKADENNCVAFKNKTDFVEVVHGKWIYNGAIWSNWTCSNCNNDVDDFELNYCPNCGAKMDN